MGCSNRQSVAVLLVPGAFAGAWMWEDVVEQLAAGGARSHVVELPTYGAHAQGKTFADDVAAVAEAIAATAPVLVAAHSYGGAVITAAAAGQPSVRELVYVAAAAPGSGESMASVSGAAAAAAGQSEDGPGPVARDDGLMVFPGEIARQALFNDCSDERAEQGMARLEPQSLAGTDEPIEIAAWTEVPSVYLRGVQDRVPRALSADFLQRCAEVIDLPTGHCPQWSRPELVAEILRTQLARTELS